MTNNLIIVWLLNSYIKPINEPNKISQPNYKKKNKDKSSIGAVYLKKKVYWV